MKTNTKPKPAPTEAEAQETYAKRRQHRRFAVDINASVWVGDRQREARTRDISRSGLCLVAMESIPRDTSIDLQLVLTFGGDGMSEPLRLTGQVVWCTALFGAYQVGVKFVKVDEEQARYLNMFIGFLDGSLSTGELDDDDDAETERPDDPDDPFRS
jgi:hypothetical protein